ncbi:MAG: alpha/beta fold hydrolase [Candidatus Lokiarchaeota archaeon]|nr:alpha/beta fold hydrolase [Candidatus Lokiarchaeota archaeon]
MPEIKNVFIKNGELILEAEIYISHSDDHNGAILITHPHPSYGGNMHNNVVSAVFNTFITNGISSLRFNFRGVGLSNGSHSDGTGELSDVNACIDYLISIYNYQKIFICGYSYGAAIGCSAVNYSEKIIGYCAISFPWDFMGSKFKKLSQTDKPKLFIQGDNDTIALYTNFNEHYQYYLTPKTKKIIEGADHFYWGFEHLVAKEVYDFFIATFH